MKKLSFALLALLAALALAASGQDANTIKFSVAIIPSKVIVDRNPSAGKLGRGTATFLLKAENTSTSDYSKTLTPGQVFEIEVYDVKKPATPIWKFSTGKKFQASTTLKIKAGDAPVQKEVWSFDPTKVPDGEYKVVATFLATGAKSEMTFSIVSSL